MPTKTKPTPRPARKRSKKPASRLPVFAIVVGFVVLIGVIAIIASRGGKSNEAAKQATTAGLQQIQSVTVTGTPLPDEPDNTSAPDSAISKTTPEMRGKSFDGSTVNIVNDGKAKVVVFMAHWCPHCQKEIPILADYLKANPAPADVELFGVSTSVDKNLPNYPPSAWLERVGWKVPTLADDQSGSAGRAYGLKSFPYFVAVKKDGTVAARTSGEISTADFALLISRAAGRS